MGKFDTGERNKGSVNGAHAKLKYFARLAFFFPLFNTSRTAIRTSSACINDFGYTISQDESVAPSAFDGIAFNTSSSGSTRSNNFCATSYTFRPKPFSLFSHVCHVFEAYADAFSFNRFANAGVNFFITSFSSFSRMSLRAPSYLVRFGSLIADACMKTSSPTIDEVDASSSSFPSLLSRVSLLVEDDNDDDEDVDGSNSRRGKTINRNRVATSLIFSSFYVLAEEKTTDTNHCARKINQRKKNRSGHRAHLLRYLPPRFVVSRPSFPKEREREKKKARNLLFFVCGESFAF